MAINTYNVLWGNFGTSNKFRGDCIQNGSTKSVHYYEYVLYDNYVFANLAG